MSYIDIEQSFFGRKTALELIRKRIADCKEGCRQNVALLGSPFVGKSSILRYLCQNTDDAGLVMVYLDLEQKDFSYFCLKFLTSILYDFARIKGLPLQDDLAILMETTKKFIPHSVEVIQKILSDFYEKKINDCYLGLLTLPEIFTTETGKSCVLIFDEFQAIGDWEISNAFQMLGKKIMTQKRSLYLFASSYPTQAREILSEKLSLLFGNFEEINIAPFDLKESQEFIDFNLRDLKIGAQLKSFLVDFTGGYPLYLNLICHELINISAILRQQEIYLPILSQAVESTIFNRWGVISRHFELIVSDLCNDKYRVQISALLLAIASGRSKLSDILNVVGISKAQLTSKLNRLMDQGIIQKNGNYFYIPDKLFRYWLKYVYQKRQKDVVISFDQQRRSFKDEFQAMVEEFRLNTGKAVTDRIVELLLCFDNDSFDLNGRKYKMPNFSSVELMKWQNSSGMAVDALVAKSQDQHWFIVPNKDNFMENDVAAIVAEAQKMPKPERCVIIALARMEDNIRVRALQEHFWVWSNYELNMLLTLFDKPGISL